MRVVPLDELVAHVESLFFRVVAQCLQIARAEARKRMLFVRVRAHDLR